MFTTTSKISDWLQADGVMDLINREIPGLAQSPNFAHMKESSVKDLQDILSTSQLELFTALINVANGEEFNYTKSDEPELPRVRGGELTYNIDDMDGQLYMLDRRFSGCLVLRFTKELDVTMMGTVTFNGEVIKDVLLQRFEMAGNVQMLGVFVRDLFTEYGTEYTLTVEGFVDQEGLMMELQELKIKTLQKPEIDLAYEENEEVALNTAREGIVLLKNDNFTLPLSSDSKIYLHNAREFRLGVAGAGRINPRYSIGLLRGIEEYSDFKISEQAPTAIFVISRGTGENLDGSPIKGEFYLTDKEESDLQELTQKYEKVIAVINSAYPIDLRWIEKYELQAALWCGCPGMLGGKAIVEILDGRVNPSGKLPDTWSLDYYDIPASANFYVATDGRKPLSTDSTHFVDTVYEEDIYIGYKFFETFDKPVMYPFGFGLSYTTFEITASYDNRVLTSVVKNVGMVAGKEVVQVYVVIPDGKLEQPKFRLVGFAKSKMLEPNEEQTLVINVDTNMLTSFDTDAAAWVMEKGSYQFFIGNAVNQLTLCGQLELADDRVVKQSKNLMTPPVEIDVLSKCKNNFPKGEHSGVKTQMTTFATRLSVEKYRDEEISGEDFIDSLSVEELARLSVCGASGWGMHMKGEAGRVFKIREDQPDFIVADGNNGVNLVKPNIGMPTSNTVCATFNTELAYQVGHVIAKEAKENNIHLILAPGMNLHRNPLNGRHPEYFSEDPYLSGMMAGHQSKGLEDSGVSSCLKHTVANNCETARKRNQSLLSERAMRELYLKTFEVAMSVHQPDSIMTGYNASNGCFTGADEEMIYGIFRKEFGFEGFVMTDWNSYDTMDIVAGIQAGNCWMTPGSTDDTYVTPIVEGVENGSIDMTRLRANVRYMMRVVQKRTGIDLGVK